MRGRSHVLVSTPTAARMRLCSADLRPDPVQGLAQLEDGQGGGPVGVAVTQPDDAPHSLSSAVKGVAVKAFAIVIVRRLQ